MAEEKKVNEAALEEKKEKAVKTADKGSKKAKKAKKDKKPRKGLGTYLKEMKSELKKITWYSWHDTLHATIWVCIALVILGAILGVVDLAFSKGLIPLLNSIT